MLCTNVICNGSFPARTFSIYFSFSLYSANIAGPNFALIVVCVCVGWREREKKTFYVRFQLRALIDKLYGPTCLAKGITLNAFQVFPLMRTESRLPYIHCNVCFFFFFTFLLFTRMFTTISFGLVWYFYNVEFGLDFGNWRHPIIAVSRWLRSF